MYHSTRTIRPNHLGPLNSGWFKVFQLCVAFPQKSILKAVLLVRHGSLYEKHIVMVCSSGIISRVDRKKK